MNKNISILMLLFFLILSSFSGEKSNPPKTPKNIILLIGDGMGTSQIYAGLTANHGKLNLEKCTHVGFSKTQSSDDYVTDSAAGATALSIGKKTYNGAIGVDSTGKAHETILETAEKKGMATGLVATCSITHATPGSFIAHQPQRSMDQEIVIITADHETGGMAVTSGNMKTGEVEAKYVTDGHTGVMVPVFAYGPGAEAFSGIYPNTEIYKKMMRALGLTVGK